MARRLPPERATFPYLATALWAVLAVVPAGCAPALSSAPGPPPADEAVVTRVTDGDTIQVRFAGTDADTTIRLIGIDTPETKRPNTPVECFGREASDHMVELLPEGTRVRIEHDVEREDAYRRTLGYVFRLDDGLFVNRAQVEDGYAAPYRYPPNVAHADELSEAGRRARDGSRGLWARCEGVHTTATR